MEASANRTAAGELVFVGTDRRLTRQIVHHLIRQGSTVCTATGATSLSLPGTARATRARAGGRRPVLACVTWADVLRGDGAASIVTRVLDVKRRTRNTGPVTICLVPYGAFLSAAGAEPGAESADRGGSQMWLRADGGETRRSAAAQDPVDAVAAECLRAGLSARIVSAPMLLVPRVHEVGEYPSLINRVIGVARCLAREVLDKAPGYAEHYPLRLNLDASAKPSLITASALARWLAMTASLAAAPLATKSKDLELVTLRSAVPWSMCIDALRESAGITLALRDSRSDSGTATKGITATNGTMATTRTAATAGFTDTALDRLFNELVFEGEGVRWEEYEEARTACQANTTALERSVTFETATAEIAGLSAALPEPAPPGVGFDAVDVDAGAGADDLLAAMRDLCAAPPVDWESTYRSSHDYDLDAIMTRCVAAPASSGEVSGRSGARGVYYDGGGEGPAVLMLAPVGIDPGYFGNLAAELMCDHRVIVWVESESHTEPHAESDGGHRAGSDDGGAPDDEARVRSRAAAVRQVLDDVGIESCHVVAWCVGVEVVGEVLRECPSRIESIALFSPDIGGGLSPTREYKSLIDLFTLIARSPDDADAIVARARRIVKMTAAGDADQYRSGLVSPLQYRSAALARRAVRVFDAPAHVVRWARQFLDMVREAGSMTGDPGLRDYHGPVVTILGTHDSLLEWTALERRCEGFAHGTMVTIRGGNHYVLTEHAPIAGELLRRFIRDGELTSAGPLIDGGRVAMTPVPRYS